MPLDLAAVFGPYQKQAEFLTSPARHRLFLAGRGAGKSWTLTLDALLQALANPGVRGALLGRTERDLKRNLLPFLKGHLATLAQATGYNWVRKWSPDEQTIWLQNGAGILWAGYERVDKLRGLNLAWINADEVCWSSADELTIWETLLPAMRLPCPRPSFAVATSPNGLRGIVKLFRDRQLEADPSYHVTRASSWHNPHLDRAVIHSMIAGMSVRRKQQEIDAIALRPQSAVFPDFRESTPLLPWSTLSTTREARLVIGADWGLNRAAAVAIDVMPDGRWVVFADLVAEPESRGHFRAALQSFIATHANGRTPYLIAGDRAVPEEMAWLRHVYSAKGTRVLSLRSHDDQQVRAGLSLMGDMLSPVVGSPRLLFATSLSRLTVGVVAPVVPAMMAYRWRVDSEGNSTDEPYKDNVNDHVLDGLRYAVVAGARYAELHAGRLPARHWQTALEGSTA